jgi:Fe(3+) dicitrate transport protein
MQWHRTQLALSHRVRPVANLEIKTTVYRNDLRRAWRKLNAFEGAALFDVLADPTTARNRAYHDVLTGAQDTFDPNTLLLIGPNDRTFVSQGIQTVARYTPRTGPIEHKMEYGLRFHYDEIARRHTQDPFAMVGGGLVPTLTPTQVTADNTASTAAIALHAIDAMTWGRVTITPGMRVESILGRFVDRLGQGSSAHHLAVLPGISTYVATLKDLGVLAGVYRGFSPPIPDDLKAKPEDSINIEAGARYDGKLGRLELIGFLNEYSNITNVCTLSNGCLDKNLDRQLDGGAARIAGLEAFGRTAPKIGPFWFPMRAAYTLTFSEFLTDFLASDPVWGSVKAGDEIPYLPISQISAGAGIETRTMGLNIAGTYMGDMREKPGQGIVPPAEITDAYFELDASAFYRVGSHVTFYVNGRNVLDQRALVARRPYGARTLAPISLQAGVKLHF